MRKKDMFMAVILALSLIGCGNQEADSAVEAVAMIEEAETVAENEIVVEESTEIEPEEDTYTECGDLYMLDSGRNDGTQVDLESWDTDQSEYVIDHSINVYYTDTSLAGYTKEGITISVALSNGEWNFCIFDRSGENWKVYNFTGNKGL